MNNRTVIIKLVDRKEGNNTFNSHVRYNNTKDTLSPYYEANGVLYTGLTPERAEYFGQRLKQDLSLTSRFWDEYKVVMNNKPKVLHLDNILHELEYEFLKGHYRVANSITDENVGIKDYIIIDEDREAELLNNKAALKIKANELFGKMSTENKKAILKLYPGFTSTDTVSAAIIDARLYEKLEKDPAKFIEHAEDKKRDLKVFLKDLVAEKILRKNKSSYYYGSDFLGHDEESTIEYLEHPDHQGLKIDLMKQLEVNKSK